MLALCFEELKMRKMLICLCLVVGCNNQYSAKQCPSCTYKITNGKPSEIIVKFPQLTGHYEFQTREQIEQFIKNLQALIGDLKIVLEQLPVKEPPVETKK